MHDNDSLELEELRACPKCSFRDFADLQVCKKCGLRFSKFEALDSPPAKPVIVEEQGQPVSSSQRSTNRTAQHSMARIAQRSTRGPIALGVLVLLLALYWWQRSPPYEVVGKPIGQGYPTVILLHGFGAPANDLVPFAKELSQQVPDASFVLLAAPHSAGNGGAWVVGGSHQETKAQAQESKDRILDAIGDLKSKDVAAEDMYLGGFSQGAKMALDLGLGTEIDSELAGLFLLSGGVSGWPGFLAPSDYSDGNLKDKHRVLIAHGNVDSVLPFTGSKAVHTALVELGIQSEFLRFEGGHQIPLLVQDAIIEILESH